MTSSFWILRIEKEFVKTVVTKLVKTAILIYFVQNNVKLNIKWNMTEDNDMFNTLAYPILILGRFWHTHLKTQTIDAWSVILSLQNTVALIYHIP